MEITVHPACPWSFRSHKLQSIFCIITARFGGCTWHSSYFYLWSSCLKPKYVMRYWWLWCLHELRKNTAFCFHKKRLESQVAVKNALKWEWQHKRYKQVILSMRRSLKWQIQSIWCHIFSVFIISEINNGVENGRGPWILFGIQCSEPTVQTFIKRNVLSIFEPSKILTSVFV